MARPTFPQPTQFFGSNEALWQGPGANAPWRNMPQAAAPPPSFDPTGYYPNIDEFGDEYRPDRIMAGFLQTPEARGYQDVGRDVQTLGVDTMRGGEGRAIRGAREDAAAQGLGRGYAGQLEADIRQKGSQEAAQAMLSGRLEEKARRFQMQSMYAQSLMEASKARYAAYLAERQIDAAEEAGDASILGGVFQGLGAIVGAAI